MRQIKTGQSLGLIKLLVQNVVPYFNMFTMVFAGIAAYVPISAWCIGMGFQLPFWMFGLIVMAVVITLPIAEYMIMMPSFYASWNKQVWEHDNPIKKEVEEMQAKLDRIEEKLK